MHCKSWNKHYLTYLVKERVSHNHTEEATCILCCAIQKHICETELMNVFSQIETFKLNLKSYLEHFAEIQNWPGRQEMDEEKEFKRQPAKI